MRSLNGFNSGNGLNKPSPSLQHNEENRENKEFNANIQVGQNNKPISPMALQKPKKKFVQTGQTTYEESKMPKDTQKKEMGEPITPKPQLNDMKPKLNGIKSFKVNSEPQPINEPKKENVPTHEEANSHNDPKSQKILQGEIIADVSKPTSQETVQNNHSDNLSIITNTELEINNIAKANTNNKNKGIENREERQKDNDKQHSPQQTKNSRFDNKNVSQNTLSLVDFYCLHYSVIKEIIDSVLSLRYSTQLAKAIDDKTLRQKIENESSEDIRHYIEMKKIPNIDYKHMVDYINIIFSEAMGFGILEYMLNDNSINEIMVVDYNDIYIEKNGLIEKTEYKFPSFDVALGIVRRIIRPLNKTLDVSNPNVDGQLPNGSRISASIPPLRAEGAISITIRKFAEKVMPLQYYCDTYHSLTPEMVQFIEACVKGRKTLIVSGGTGSGKTTMLNSLSFAIDKNERIIVIEDTREIKAQIPHVEYYLKLSGNAEGYKGISISDIIQNSLRKRPDRIIVGECRGGEFNEYLNAANTGHDGSMTSVHANSPQELFSRMENMLMKNDETKNMTHESVMRTLASSVDIIVQTKRLPDGSRRITNVSEVLGYGQDGFDKLVKMKLAKSTDACDENRVYLRDIFYFKEMKTEEIDKGENGEMKLKVTGQFLATGYVPFCNRELRRKGVGFDNSFFEKRVLYEVK